MGDEDFLAAVEADNAKTPVEEAPEANPPEPAPEPAEQGERQRDEHGRFAPKEAAPAAPEPTPAPEPAPTPEPQHAPLAALLDERDRRKAAEEQLRQLQQQRQAPQPVEIPDMITDPEAYNAFVTSQIDNRLYGERLFMSEQLGRMKHGETFDAMKEWGVGKCDTDPHFNQKVRSSQDPYGVVADEWKREQAASIPASELEQFRQWKAAQSQLSAQPTPQGATQPVPPAIPPPSLASAPSAGTMLTEPEQSDDEIFAETFRKRK